jgi:hypothetical protein
MAEPSIKDIAYRTAASVFGGPVDLATMVMRPFGYKTPDTQVVGGSEWIGKKMEDVGLVSTARAPLTEFIASVAVPTPGGIAKGAAMAAPAIGGMFIGKGARTWDALAAQKAKMMADMNIDPRTIWKETGTWKGPDGKWRQEISDKPAFYDPEALTELKSMDSFNYLKNTQPLGGVVEHKELYKAYPEVGDIPVHFMPTQNLRGAEGSYSHAQNRLTLADIPSDQKSIAIHETQHAIQGKEGFARGGSPSSMVTTLEELASQKRQKAQEMFSLSSANDPLNPLKIVKPGARKKGLELEKEARELDSKALAAYRSEQAKFDLYQRLGGEAEARATQARMNMTPEQRRAMFPEESYDVPLNELIIRGVSD